MIILFLLSIAWSWSGAGEAERPLGAGDCVRLMDQHHPSRAGADHLGNLWLFDPLHRSISLVSPRGRLLGNSGEVGDVMAVMDARWGVAFLRDGGKTVVVRGPGSAELVASLDEPAFDLAWVDARSIATTPRRGRALIQVWRVRPWRLERSLGHPAANQGREGVILDRSVFLHMDFGHGRLVSLDGYSGDVRVWDPHTGQCVWRAGVRHPDAPEIEAYISERRRQVRSGSSEHLSFILWDGFAILPDGDVVLCESCSPGEAPHAVVVRLGPGRPGRRMEVPVEGCCSRRLAGWSGNTILFLRDPMRPGTQCSGVANIGVEEGE